jgi:hypothetical protein
MLYLHEGFSTLPCDAVVVAERAAEPRRLLTLLNGRSRLKRLVMARLSDLFFHDI